MWIGRVNSLANNLPRPPYSDSCSSRAAAELAKKAKKQAKHDRSALMGVHIVKPPVFARSPLFGGHTICTSSHEGVEQWKCSVCYMPSSNWDTFALAKCRGSLAERWALAEVAAAEAVGEVGPGHHRMLAGELVWCLICGCYG